MEQEYLKEYYYLVEKDKADGKDFNKIRHDEMMSMQFEFAHRRKQEKQRFQDQMRRKKRQEMLEM